MGITREIPYYYICGEEKTLSRDNTYKANITAAVSVITNFCVIAGFLVFFASFQRVCFTQKSIDQM